MSLGERISRAWASHDPLRVAALYCEDGVREEFTLPRAVLRGRAQVAEQVGRYMTAVPDCRVEIRRELLARDGTVTLEWTWTGRHTQDIEGWLARREHVRLPGVAVYDMDGGLIRKENVYADMAIMLAGARMLIDAEVQPEP
jgi:steroid delta-isomerase-like uncharacterized protein